MSVATRSSSPAKTKAKPTAKPKRSRGSKPRKASVAKKRTSKSVKVAKPVTVEVAAPPSPSPVVTDEHIAARAYEIWLEKGRPFGQEDENWAQALAELRG